MNSLHSSHSVYVDSGIFAYYGTCAPKYSNDLVVLMAEQADKAATRMASEEELNRAKDTLYACLCYDFEDRQVIFEDMCRQTKVYGIHRTPDMLLEAITKVTAGDVQRVAQNMLMLTPKPAVVCLSSTPFDLHTSNLL